MIVAFFGHSDYVRNAEDEQRILEILQKEIGDKECEIFLGEYGKFDYFAYSCAKKYKATHPSVKLVFVTPYMDEKYIERKLDTKNKFDLILYPPLEKVPKSVAIPRRNRWIVDKADIVIVYVKHSFGEAYTAFEYADRKNKNVYNVAQDRA